MADSAQWTAWITAGHLTSVLVSVACEIGAVVLVATVVRRHRPDAYGSLLAWAIVALALGVVWPAFTTASFALAARHSIDDLLRLQVIQAFASIPIFLVPFALLLRGIVKLAQPPKPVSTEPVGPYR